MTLLCKLGIHRWKYYTGRFSIVRNDIDIVIRKCSSSKCGKKQHSGMPKSCGIVNWKDLN